jgi:hypothetical protein
MASDDFRITYKRPPSKLFDTEETRKIIEQELTTASIKSVGEFHGALVPKTPFVTKGVLGRPRVTLGGIRYGSKKTPTS